MKQRVGMASLFHHRWAVPIMAELYRRHGERYAFLARRFGISRETLSQTLTHLINQGWVRRNPGYGHPLRPEYILTPKGELLGPLCVRLDDALNKKRSADLGLRKWTLPLIHAIATTSGPSRFSQLLITLNTLTPKSLSESLKRMEVAGWIVRDVTGGFPPSTRYSLTPLGKRFQTIVTKLAGSIP